MRQDGWSRSLPPVLGLYCNRLRPLLNVPSILLGHRVCRMSVGEKSPTPPIQCVSCAYIVEMGRASRKVCRNSSRCPYSLVPVLQLLILLYRLCVSCRNAGSASCQICAGGASGGIHPPCAASIPPGWCLGPLGCRWGCRWLGPCIAFCKYICTGGLRRPRS